MFHQNAFLGQSPVVCLVLFCKRTFLGFLFWGFAVFMIIANPLETAVTVDSDGVVDFLAHFFLIHSELVGASSISHNRYDLLCFLVPENK